MQDRANFELEEAQSRRLRAEAELTRAREAADERRAAWAELVRREQDGETLRAHHAGEVELAIVAHDRALDEVRRLESLLPPLRNAERQAEEAARNVVRQAALPEAKRLEGIAREKFVAFCEAHAACLGYRASSFLPFEGAASVYALSGDGLHDLAKRHGLNERLGLRKARQR